jgi:choline-glycine betaine transporter
MKTNTTFQYFSLSSISGVFTFFGLVIFHVKHHYERYYCQALYDIQESACPNRLVSIGWPVPVAWVGLVLCVMDSILWGFLTQALRIIKTKTMSDKY